MEGLEESVWIQSYEGMILEATLARRSALAFWSLGMDEILNVIKCSVRACTKD